MSGPKAHLIELPNMRVWILGICAVSGFASWGQDIPQTMTKLSVRLQSPELQEGSFASKPKIMYRAGNGYCRTEEMPDNEHGIHGLMIINEPDTWMVNLFSRTAQHYRDQGPTFNCRMPIFIFGEDVKSAGDLKGPTFELEFGHELAYFKRKGAMAKRGPVLQGKPTNVYTVEAIDSQILLFTTGTPERPLVAIRVHGNVRETYWYAMYEQLPFDPKLFAKPQDVRIEDIKQ